MTSNSEKESSDGKATDNPAPRAEAIYEYLSFSAAPPFCCRYEKLCSADVEGQSDDSGEIGNSDPFKREQHALMREIISEYILDGSPNEINLSSKDKKDILEFYKMGNRGFYALPADTRRFVFARAYTETRFVLESNLMNKFVSSDGFKAAIAAD